MDQLEKQLKQHQTTNETTTKAETPAASAQETASVSAAPAAPEAAAAVVVEAPSEVYHTHLVVLILCVDAVCEQLTVMHTDYKLTTR